MSARLAIRESGGGGAPQLGSRLEASLSLLLDASASDFNRSRMVDWKNQSRQAAGGEAEPAIPAGL